VIDDDVAEERIAELTESGPIWTKRGPKQWLRATRTRRDAGEHETNPEPGEDDAVVGGNVEQVRMKRGE